MIFSTQLKGLHSYTIRLLQESSDDIIIDDNDTTFLFSSYFQMMQFSRNAYEIGISYLEICHVKGIPVESGMPA